MAIICAMGNITQKETITKALTMEELAKFYELTCWSILTPKMKQMIKTLKQLLKLSL